jgi:hypothetical protein
MFGLASGDRRLELRHPVGAGLSLADHPHFELPKLVLDHVEGDAETLGDLADVIVYGDDVIIGLTIREGRGSRSVPGPNPCASPWAVGVAEVRVGDRPAFSRSQPPSRPGSTTSSPP